MLFETTLFKVARISKFLENKRRISPLEWRKMARHIRL